MGRWVRVDRRYKGGANTVNNIQLLCVSDYGIWKLTNGAAQSGRSLSIGALPHVNNITMIDATDSYNLATASALVRRNSFTTTWRDSW